MADARSFKPYMTNFISGTFIICWILSVM